MAETPSFNKALVWTLLPIALGYTGMVLMTMSTDHSGKMQMMNIIATLVPATLFAFLAGLAVFLPAIIAGPERGRRFGLWVAHMTLSTLASIVMMVVGVVVVMFSG